MEKECIFCRIINGEEPATFLYQDDHVVAFNDINPHAPVHILIVPRKHLRSINDLTDDARPIMADLIFSAKRIAKEKGIDRSGYKLVFNVERGGGQYVFHLHLHLVGGWEKGRPR